MLDPSIAEHYQSGYEETDPSVIGFSHHFIAAASRP